MLLLSRPFTWAMSDIETNMITCASGVPRDLGGISFQLVMGGVVMVWR